MMAALRRLKRWLFDGKRAVVEQETKAALQDHSEASRQVRIAARLSRIKSREARRDVEHLVASGQADRVRRAVYEAASIAQHGRR